MSPLCLGTMMFGAWGNTDHEDSIRIIHRALDAGINFVDTADVYSAGESEEIVGKALKGRRDDVVLATKLCMPMGEAPNIAAARDAGSSEPSRTRYDGWAPTTSTSTSEFTLGLGRRSTSSKVAPADRRKPPFHPLLALCADGHSQAGSSDGCIGL